MDKSERMELRRRRLERLGKWNAQSSPPPVVSQPAQLKLAAAPATTSTATKRCGCSRSKG